MQEKSNDFDFFLWETSFTQLPLLRHSLVGSLGDLKIFPDIIVMEESNADMVATEL